MKKIGLLCLLGTLLFAEEEVELVPSTSEQVAALQSISLIDGKISPASGSLCLQQTDLVARGAEPVMLMRTYVTPCVPCRYHANPNINIFLAYQNSPIAGGWNLLPHLFLGMIGPKIQVSDSNGLTLEYRISKGKTELLSSVLGLHNLGPDGPTRRLDPRNTQIELQGNRVLVKSADGTVCEYRQITPYSYRLSREHRPNGKILRYVWQGHTLTRIESCDPEERYVYAQIHHQQHDWVRHFTTDSGLKASWIFDQRVWKGKIKERKKRRIYVETGSCPFLSKVRSPNFVEQLTYTQDFLLASQSTQDEMCHFAYSHSTPRRVACLSKPGYESFCPTHEMSYGAGHCHRFIDGATACYHYNDNLLPSRITHSDRNGEIFWSEVFDWNDQGWLLSRRVCDSSGAVISEKSYEYDDLGNPIVERNVEGYAIRRAFDDRSLVVEEAHDNGLVIRLHYLKGTDLVTAKLTGDSETIWQRHFWLYDDCFNLACEIEDDGSGDDPDDLRGVTERHVTRIERRETAPYLHMPRSISKFYLSDGSEKLLRRSDLTYDVHGRVVCREEVYDATGSLSHALDSEYNDRGDLLSQINALGEKTTYAYDERGNCVSAIDGAGRRTESRYNEASWLVEQDRCGHSTHYTYTDGGQLARTRDYLDRTTDYSYSEAHGELIRKERLACEPLVQSFKRDDLGRVICAMDEEGNCTRHSYNHRNQIVKTEHPGGGVECWNFAPDGTLHSYVDQEDRVTEYERDVLGRVICERVVMDGCPIAEQRWNCRGFRCTEYMDREGFVTHYTYDGAGRRIAEEREGRITRFGYDALGHHAEITRGGQRRRRTYDLLDRVASEAVIGDTLASLVEYSYDRQGNCCRTMRHVDLDRCEVTERSYDKFDRLVNATDPEGRTTTWSFVEIPEESWKVVQRTKTEPCGRQTTDRFNVTGHLVQRTIANGSGMTLADTVFMRNGLGQVTQQVDHVHRNGESTRLVHSFWSAPDE